MVIQMDTREKARATERIEAEFNKQGVQYIKSKLYVGDYMAITNPLYVIDRKQNLLEVAVNVCQDHKRFKAEVERAKSVGIKMCFLVEHGYNIRCLEDVLKWQNPRLKESPMAVSGERLYKIMSTMSKTYGFEWQFCDKRQTGKRIIELLEAHL